MYQDAINVWRNGNKDELMEKFFKKFTYCSNKIENCETRLRDVENVFKGNPIQDFQGSLKTIDEIKNHKALCKEIVSIANENKARLSVDLIKDFHYRLMKGCFTEKLLSKGEKPGEFKKGDYVVGLFEVGVCPEEVEENLVSLIEEINEVEITEKNALKVASYFHCWFESIHPFADGNGRVGRMLLNYLLIGNNLPPVVLFEMDREPYYCALEYFNFTQDISKMVEFLEDESYKSWVKDYNIKTKMLKDYLN